MNRYKVRVFDRSLQLTPKNDGEDGEILQFSMRESLRVLDLLKNPPSPNSKLLAAAQALPQLF
jgi:hypothetical protein